MRIATGIIAVFTVGWTPHAGADAAADDERPARTVILRVCDVLDGEVLDEILGGHLPEVRFVLGEGEAADTPWLAELCFDGETVVSTVTNTESGASNTETWPMPDDADGRARERFAAHVLANQIRGFLDARPPADSAGGVDDAQEDVDPASDAAPPFAADLYLSLGLDAVGGLTYRTDEASIAVGPAFRLGVVLGRHGMVGIGVRSLTVVGAGASLNVLDTVPLSLEGGWAGTVGPVEFQALLEVIAEQWTASGVRGVEGWRAGLGLSGGLIVPITGFLDYRVDFGIEFFTEGYAVREEIGNTQQIVADLSNLRWRASTGLELRIPLF